MGNIVNLQYKECPKLFKYFLRNKRDKVLDRWKLIYIHVEEEEIINLSNVKGLEDEITSVMNSPVCVYCGSRTTGGLFPIYRGRECISKYINCPVCMIMSDRYFSKVVNMNEVDKSKEIKKFVSMLI